MRITVIAHTATIQLWHGPELIELISELDPEAKGLELVVTNPATKSPPLPKQRLWLDGGSPEAGL